MRLVKEKISSRFGYLSIPAFLSLYASHQERVFMKSYQGALSRPRLQSKARSRLIPYSV